MPPREARGHICQYWSNGLNGTRLSEISFYESQFAGYLSAFKYPGWRHIHYLIISFLPISSLTSLIISFLTSLIISSLSYLTLLTSLNNQLCSPSILNLLWQKIITSTPEEIMSTNWYMAQICYVDDLTLITSQVFYTFGVGAYCNRIRREQSFLHNSSCLLFI